MQPRHDIDAEKAIIGAAILDQRILGEFTIAPEDFYWPDHEQLWSLIITEHRAGRPIGVITLTQALVSSPIPGVKPEYLHGCLDGVNSPAAASHFAEIVKGLAGLRRLGAVGTQLMTASQTAGWEDSEQALDNARSDLDRAAAAATGIRVRTFSDALKDAVEVWDSPRKRGTPTGWPDLDRKLNGGWHPGQLTVIGARPAVGKSVVASCAAVANAEAGVGLFSLEMREAEIVARMTAAAQGVELSRLNNSKVEETDWERISKLARKSADWPTYIEDKSMITMAQIRAHVRTWSRRGPLKLVIIDYLQLVTPADRSESRERQVSRIAEDCKHLAKEFDTHVIALAQVNRGSTQRENKRPTESDLRESGGIEAFADNIILLHREKGHDGEIEFIIAKNRHGETGTVNLVWRPHVASVNSMSNETGAYRHGMATDYAA